MRAEIISVGTELLLGQIVDTNAPYLGRALSALGIDVYHRETVGDNSERLADSLREALKKADLIVTIGGLGPTQDDLTKETIAEVLGEKMIPDPESEKTIIEFFKKRNVEIVPSNLKQALITESGAALPNSAGTAPGMLVEKDGKTIIALPGPPHEFIPMVERHVIPLMRKKNGGTVIVSRVLRLAGIGESAAEAKLIDLLGTKNPTIAPLASSSEVHFRITAKASGEEEARKLISGLENKVRERLGNFIYGTDDENLETAVVRMLTQRGLKLALAESCTGGLLASRITDVPGSSKIFLAGFVAYDNSAKENLLGVPSDTLKKHGAVSPEVAEAMANGAVERTGADIAVGITGIAGPDGGTPEKPVGLVYIGIKTPAGTTSVKNTFGGSRPEIKRRSSQIALNMIRNYLLES